MSLKVVDWGSLQSNTAGIQITAFQAIIAGRRQEGCAINKTVSEQGAPSCADNMPGAPGRAAGVSALQSRAVLAGLAHSPREKGKQRKQTAFGNGRVWLGTKGSSQWSLKSQKVFTGLRAAGSLWTLAQDTDFIATTDHVWHLSSSIKSQWVNPG